MSTYRNNSTTPARTKIFGGCMLLLAAGFGREVASDLN